MLPILFKIQFDTLASQLVYLAIALAFVAYGAWAGAHNAEKKEHRLFRALPFAFCAALVVSLATVWAFPPMGEALARAIRCLVYGFGALLTLSAALYGYKAAPKKDDAVAEALKYGAIGAALTIAAAKVGLTGEMGRGSGLPLHTYGLMIATASPIRDSEKENCFLWGYFYVKEKENQSRRKDTNSQSIHKWQDQYECGSGTVGSASKCSG